MNLVFFKYVLWIPVFCRSIFRHLGAYSMADEVKKIKKQVYVNEEMYNKVRGKMVVKGKSFTDWLDEKMKEEIKHD